jgi:hypothetical protein
VPGRLGARRRHRRVFEYFSAPEALARGERIHLVCHEDVLVFRKPEAAEPAGNETVVGTGRAAA